MLKRKEKEGATAPCPRLSPLAHRWETNRSSFRAKPARQRPLPADRIKRDATLVSAAGAAYDKTAWLSHEPTCSPFCSGHRRAPCPTIWASTLTLQCCKANTKCPGIGAETCSRWRKTAAPPSLYVAVYQRRTLRAAI